MKTMSVPATYRLRDRTFATEAEMIAGREVAMVRTPSGHMRMFTIADGRVHRSVATVTLDA